MIVDGSNAQLRKLLEIYIPKRVIKIDQVKESIQDFIGCTNLKSVDVNFDPSDVAFLERGEHVQDWVEAAPSGETEVKNDSVLWILNLSNYKSKHLC